MRKEKVLPFGRKKETNYMKSRSDLWILKRTEAGKLYWSQHSGSGILNAFRRNGPGRSGVARGRGSVPPDAICLSRTGLVAHDGVDDTVEPPRHDRDGDAMVLVLGPLLPVELAQFRTVPYRAFFDEPKDALEAVCFHFGDGLAARLELARLACVGVRSRVLEDGGHS